MSLSRGQVLRLAVPVMLANLSLPLLGLVDTAMLGHLDSPRYLAGMAVGNQVYMLLFFLFGFLRMGTTGFAAQAHGAGDRHELAASFTRAALVGLAIGLFFIAAQSLVLGQLIPLFGDAPEAIDPAQTYYAIRVWGAPASYFNAVLMGWLIGTQQGRLWLVLQLILNGLNGVLNVSFVLGLGMDVDGVALGTAISEYVAAILGLFIIRWQLAGRGAHLSLEGVFTAAAMKQLFTVNGDIFIRTACLVASFFLLLREAASFGADSLAAVHVLLQFQTFLAFGLDGFAYVAESLVGEARGARDKARFEAAVRRSTELAGITALGFVALFSLGGQAIVALLTDLPDIRSAAGSYMIWMSLSPLVAIWAFQFDGIYLGVQRTRPLRNLMIVSFAGFLAGLYLFTPMWGLHGLWAAFILYLGLRGATLALDYPRLKRDLFPT